MFEDMTIYGTITYRLSDPGSKSEGYRAFLTDSGGKTYRLYRAGRLPYGDPFFHPFDGMEAGVTGECEEETDNFLVESVILGNGDEISASTDDGGTGPVEIPEDSNDEK